jgi:RNA polymerase sigma-70 factor (ECF subfamily)
LIAGLADGLAVTGVPSGILRDVKGRTRGRSSDEPLIRISVDDAKAFHEFYRAYVDRVVVFFARRTLDAETALDLTGETFALALERRAQFRGATSQEEQGWLFAIARNLLLAFWRRGEVERAALARMGCEAPEGTTADLEWVERVADLPSLRASVRSALHELPRDQAYAVTARVVEARPYSDLALELEVSEQVVRARVSRGLRAMAQTLGEDGSENLS